MATDIQLIPNLSLTAGADLSAKQFHFVKLSAAKTVVACSALTDKPIGVLQNKPTAGRPAEVMVAGVSKIVADAAITAGDTIGTSADGQADPKTLGTDITHFACGTALTAADAGDVFSGLIDCKNPARAV